MEKPSLGFGCFVLVFFFVKVKSFAAPAFAGGEERLSAAVKGSLTFRSLCFCASLKSVLPKLKQLCLGVVFWLVRVWLFVFCFLFFNTGNKYLLLYS